MEKSALILIVIMAVRLVATSEASDSLALDAQLAANETPISNSADTPADDRAMERDPFWPVGYSPRSIGSPPEDPEEVQERAARSESDRLLLWGEAESKVSISGFSRMAGEGYFAIINNRIMRAGETLSVDHGDMTFSWTIETIGDEGVKLRRLTATESQNGEQ